MRTFYLLIHHVLSGRVTIRKQRGKTWGDARERYYRSQARKQKFLDSHVISTHSKKSLVKKAKKEAQTLHGGI